MTTTARIGWGAKLSIANNSSVLTEIAEVIALALPNPQTAEVEATHFKSPNRRREYIAGLIEDGTAQFQINYDPGSATDLLIRDAQGAGTARNYEIEVPDATTNWKVSGQLIVTGYERSIPIDDRMTATVTVRFTGASTEAQAT